MNRKVVIPTLALLLLAMMVFTPAMAVTREGYWAHHEVDCEDPGMVWVTDGGIQHVKDSYWIGTNEGSLGVGIIEIWYNHICLNLDTGEGTYSGKFLITIPDVGTVAGSGRGVITGFVNSAGTWVVTHCTGEFQGSNTKGSASAAFTSATHFSMDCVGITTYH